MKYLLLLSMYIRPLHTKIFPSPTHKIDYFLHLSLSFSSCPLSLILLGKIVKKYSFLILQPSLIRVEGRGLQFLNMWGGKILGKIKKNNST